MGSAACALSPSPPPGVARPGCGDGDGRNFCLLCNLLIIDQCPAVRCARTVQRAQGTRLNQFYFTLMRTLPWRRRPNLLPLPASPASRTKTGTTKDLVRCGWTGKHGHEWVVFGVVIKMTGRNSRFVRWNQRKLWMNKAKRKDTWIMTSMSMASISE